MHESADSWASGHGSYVVFLGHCYYPSPKRHPCVWRLSVRAFRLVVSVSERSFSGSIGSSAAVVRQRLNSVPTDTIGWTDHVASTK